MAFLECDELIEFMQKQENEGISYEFLEEISGIEYEIMDSYKQYLTDERVLQAIETLKESGRFYLMPEKTQNKCVAFYLNAKTEERNYDGKITQGSVDKLLSAWKDDTKQ